MSRCMLSKQRKRLHGIHKYTNKTHPGSNTVGIQEKRCSPIKSVSASTLDRPITGKDA